jgi:tRNA U34 2-thiouridine synthase MnmA/TrmU
MSIDTTVTGRDAGLYSITTIKRQGLNVGAVTSRNRVVANGDVEKLKTLFG